MVKKKKGVGVNLGDKAVPFVKAETVEKKPESVGIAEIPEGVIELKNGCLIQKVGDAGAFIRYRKGWKQENNTIKWGPDTKIPTDVYEKLIKTMSK